MLVIAVKYITFVMRADNCGEGGILALMALVRGKSSEGRDTRRALIALGLFGSTLLYGDGVITPAISVLSAVEGVNVATELSGGAGGSPWTLPVSASISGARSLATNRPGMAIWRERLYAWMVRNASNAVAFFHLPPDRIVEVGARVEI